MWPKQENFLTFFFGFLFCYFIQHCFICRPSDSTVSEDAGIEPRTVATYVLTTRLDLLQLLNRRIYSWIKMEKYKWYLLVILLQFSQYKGTQDWEFFWLRFWFLYCFNTSYPLIWRFCNKQFLIGPLWGEAGLFRVVLRLRGMKIFWNLGQIFFFLSLVIPLYFLKIIFPKFDPLTVTGMALCVDLGPKCHNLFPLVWD